MARVLDLETSCRAALPALDERRVGDWLLRVSGGETKRVNSANPLAASARLGPVVTAAEALYAHHGLPCRFRLTPLAHPDTDVLLHDAGYSVVDRSVTMTARLAARPDDPAVRLSLMADNATLAAIALLSDRAPSALAIHAQLVNGIPGAKAFAVIVEDGTPVAAGYASVGHGRAQLSDIVVAADARGRGLGRRLVARLLGWAQAQGCGEALLQVLESNVVARNLYGSLGFVDAYPYHYRVS